MSATLIIVIVNVIASIYAWNNTSIMGKWIFNPYTVFHNKEYHRFITSGFIHGNWMHLIFNMLVLFMFGEQVESWFTQLYGEVGVVLYVVMFLAAVIVSDIPTFLKNKENSYYNALGASGGTSAILFSYILFNPIQSLCLYGILCFPGVLWGVLYIIYSVYMGKQQSDNINHDAHLWGGLFGIGFTIMIYPSVILHFLEQLRDFTLF
ncbi:MAG: rhomboid family intramembrane serine protease [Cyclobacteriaceae bacterium]|nr:rhomboid family intramembrane serine protease [Cyclobacteriaceae bacterium]